MQTVVTICGTRPELIRLSRIIPKLDSSCKHIFVYTNQNFTPNLRDIFFEDLGLRQPDYYFEQKGTLGEQLADIFPKIEKVFLETKPDRCFILGDTNSALCAIIAERMGIPLFHMESANRSFNKDIPEEVNRRLIDSIASYNIFYTPTNRHTLLKEGGSLENIFMSGNPTAEVLEYYKDKIKNSNILEKLNIVYPEWGFYPYFLVDIHRAENTDDITKLEEIIRGLNLVASNTKMKVLVSVHPRIKDKLKQMTVVPNKNILFLDAVGFFDFVNLEKNAIVGLTDSGLVSEEYCLLHVPCVIVRNETERPEVVEAGGAIISGINAERILESVLLMMNLKNKNWNIPEGYQYLNVSDKVVQYILSHHNKRSLM